MMDVLITQHARWTARRIKRALFGQCLIDFSSDSWSRVSLDNDAQHSKQKRSINLQHERIPRLVRQFSSYSVFDDSPNQEEVVVDIDSEMQSSAPEDLLQSSEFLPATAQALEADQLVDLSLT